MGSYGYERTQYEVEKAKLKLRFVRMAIAQELKEGKVCADELGIYADVLQDAESSVRYAEERFKEYECNECGDNEAKDK